MSDKNNLRFQPRAKVTFLLIVFLWKLWPSFFLDVELLWLHLSLPPSGLICHIELSSLNTPMFTQQTVSNSSARMTLLMVTFLLF